MLCKRAAPAAKHKEITPQVTGSPTVGQEKIIIGTEPVFAQQIAFWVHDCMYFNFGPTVRQAVV